MSVIIWAILLNWRWKIFLCRWQWVVVSTWLLLHTENCPKPLLPVAGNPILENISERAKLEGQREFGITSEMPLMSCYVVCIWCEAVTRTEDESVSTCAHCDANLIWTLAGQGTAYGSVLEAWWIWVGLMISWQLVDLRHKKCKLNSLRYSFVN